jgi:mannose-6-phosphate isomerase-like protein (cupin superfamily)
MLINVEPEEHFYPALDYVVFRRCTPDWRMPPQKLKVFDITYVIKGNAEYTIDDEKHTLSPGMILCLPPGTYRKGVTFDGCPMHCFSVNFHLISMGGGGVHTFLLT